MNDYYDVRLKEARLEKISAHRNFHFLKGDLADKGLWQLYLKNTAQRQ